ncbi:MAG: hypothetical protein NZ733_06500 [Aigarchaeota archaeon]|nr:hypothetical protein [Aigarchaeota archaeon]MCS7127027.1 hypothetical protein [Candidatus Calditenuaceae archaeon]MCX8203795.1 hypothetical protein [Nitrososphaeria archaeon]MDW8043149.1 hypothetical protein [Nitrososphaerota archaeon]
MRLPVCEFDVKTGTLCPKCEPLVSSGALSSEDLRVMRELLDSEPQFPQLKAAEYVRTIRAGGIFFVFLRTHSDLKPVKSRLERQLSSRMAAQVNVVEYAGNINALLEQLVRPARVTGISRVWLPDGTEQLLVKVDRMSSVMIGVDRVNDVVKALRGVEVVIEEAG